MPDESGDASAFLPLPVVDASTLTYERFLREFALPKQPCILTNVGGTWAARDWTVEHMLSDDGVDLTHKVQMADGPPGSAKEIRTTVGKALRKVVSSAKADGDGVEGTMNQDYRGQMKEAILSADAAATVIEPWDLVGNVCKELYPEGTPWSAMFKDDAHVRMAFGTCVDAAAEADVLISYLPEASMGSAIEIYKARSAGKKILVVAPGSMAGNWTVRSYADRIFSSIEELRAALVCQLHGGTTGSDPPPG